MPVTIVPAGKLLWLTYKPFTIEFGISLGAGTVILLCLSAMLTPDIVSTTLPNELLSVLLVNLIFLVATTVSMLSLSSKLY